MAVTNAAHKALLAKLREPDRANLRSASGPGAGAFLLPPSQADHIMCDAHIQVAMRMRLRAPPHLAEPSVCQHKHADTRQPCLKLLDGRGFHARTCKVGGGVVRRHDRIRDWLGAWMLEDSARSILTEEYVPRWDRRDEEGRLVRARLDACFSDAQGRQVYVDVAVTDSVTACLQDLRARARKNGVAAASLEDRKRLRYPGPDLRPFVVEAMGRLGASANALLKAYVPADAEDRTSFLGAARQSLSVLVQTGNAELILSATG